ncbi:hypothetical protein DFQ26_001692, partial [Actinomortierella ambigua]
MLVGVAVEAGSFSETLCPTWAESVQSRSNLPAKPDESGVKQLITGKVAGIMFPRYKPKLSEEESYTFIATFENCTPSPATFVSRIQPGPYSDEADYYGASDMNQQLGFDRYLTNLYRYLPSTSTEFGVSR